MKTCSQASSVNVVNLQKSTLTLSYPYPDTIPSQERNIAVFVDDLNSRFDFRFDLGFDFHFDSHFDLHFDSPFDFHFDSHFDFHFDSPVCKLFCKFI